MWLAFCYPNDAAAHWAITGLRRRGLTPLEAVTPDALVYSRSLVHEIRGGRPHTTFTLPDGRLIDSAQVAGVINRVTGVPMGHLGGASRSDAVYAEQELHALVLSALHGFGDGIINQPTPQGLAGRMRTEAEWVALAGRAGLATMRLCEGTADGAGSDAVPDGSLHQVVVLDGRTHGAATTPVVSEACVALAVLAGTRLLGVDLTKTPGGAWWFRGASPLPDLRVGGESLLDGLAQTLRGDAA